MNLPSAPTELAVGTTDELPREEGTHLRGPWLVLVRAVWVALAAVLLVIFVFSLPVYTTQLFTVSNGILYVPWQLTPESAQALQALGISLSLYAVCAIALSLLITCTWVAIAGVFFWRKSNDWMALLVAFLLVWWGTSNISVVLVPGGWAGLFLSQGLASLGNAAVFLFFYLFPNGRFVPRWMSWLAAIQILVIALQSFPTFPFNLDIWSPALSALFVASMICSIVGSQIYRYRRVSGPVQRQQTKWVVFAFTVVFTGILGDVLAEDVLHFPLPDLLTQFLDPVLWHLLPIFIPLSLGFATLRYRLWDIDLIINRTLVYGVLTVSIVALYILVVTGLGTLFQARGNLGIALLATGLVAVLFQPVRNWLQRLVNRLMYGDRDDPYRVISRLGQRLEATLAPDAVLPTIVETVAQALKLPYAAIILQQGKEALTAAAYGSARGELVRLPLVTQNEAVGELVLGPQLASLTLKLETARNRLAHDPLADTLLADLAQRTQATVAEIRRLVYALRPPALDELGLVSALRELTLQYSDQVAAHLDAPDCLPELSAAVEVAIYRIAQEALTNVVRHAAAQRCDLKLALDETSGVLTLSIQDDGCGLSPSRGVGVGLVSMRERSEELGGMWSIAQVESGGTRVLAQLPYKRSERADAAFVAPHVVPQKEE
jgi:two-component sensor histidine kinase